MLQTDLLTMDDVRDYMVCPRRYYGTHVMRLRTHPLQPRQVLSVLVRHALLAYHGAREEGVDPAANTLGSTHLFAKTEITRAEMKHHDDRIAGIVEEYASIVGRVMESGCRAGVWLAAPIGKGDYVAVRVDILWWDGSTLSSGTWHLHEPTEDEKRIQTALLHAAMRRQYPAASLRHHLIVLEPEVRMSSIPMDRASYLQAMAQVSAMPAIWQREREWAPMPGAGCLDCPCATRCDCAGFDG